MTRHRRSSRALTLLLAGGIALGAVLTPGAQTPPAEAHHYPQHQAVDLSVKLGPLEDNYWYVKPGKRVVLEAHMLGGVDRPRLTISLPPALADAVGIDTQSDTCEEKIFSGPSALPGTRIECEAFRGSINKEQPGLLFGHRVVQFEATMPDVEGEHRIEATIEPTKFWDDKPANNRAIRILKVTNAAPPPPMFETKPLDPGLTAADPGAGVAPKPVDPGLITAPGVDVDPQPDLNPCIVVINNC